MTGVNCAWAKDIYYLNVHDWGGVKCHNFGVTSTTWCNDEAQMSSTSMTKDGHTYYKITLKDAGNTTCNFYNYTCNTDNQTGNITISGNCYQGGQWINMLPITGGMIYFDNSLVGWTPTDGNKVQYFVGDGGYTTVYDMTQLAHTQLYYKDLPSYGGCTYMRFALANYSSGSFGSGNEPTNRTAAYTGTYEFNSGSLYLFTTTSGDNATAISPNYQGSAYTAMNKTVTLKAKISIDGGSTYSEVNTPGALTATSYKFNDNTTCETQDASTSASLSAGSASTTFTAGYTAETALTAAEVTGYDFMGWYEGSTKVLDTKNGTVYPHGEVTLYAYYKAKTYDGTINKNGGDANKSYTATYGLKTLSITTPTKTGYTVSGYYTNDATPVLVADASGNLQASTAYTNSSSQWTYTSSAPTLYAHWTAKTYTLTLAAGTGGSGSGSATVDYDATAVVGFTHNITNTGYHIKYWYDTDENTKILEADGSFPDGGVEGYIQDSKWCKDGNVTLKAYWEANTYKITFNATTNGGTITNNGTTYAEDGSRKLSETYNTVVTGTAPTAVKDGCHFNGWYTTASVGGVKLINADGTWNTNVSTYTSSGKWVKADNITLYARYSHGINFISFTGYYNVMPGADVVGEVHFNTDAEPEGNFTLCYVLTTGGGERMFDQPNFDRSYSDGYHKVTFAAPVTPGAYTLQARLYEEANHDCATEAGALDTYTSLEFTFNVEHTNTVTVQYKCGSVEVRPSTTVQATAYSTAVSVTAPTIKGLTFTGWTLGAGVSAVSPTTTSDQTIKIHATKDSIMTANYSQSGYVYFKNTYGWDNVYFYRYNDQNYWGGNTNDGYGMGAHKAAGWTHLCLEGPVEMEKVDGTDDLYYCKPSSTPGSTQSYVFTDKPSTEDFFGKSAEFAPINALVLNCSSWGATSAFSTTNHMIVPNKDQSPTQPGDLYAGHVNYYSEYFVAPSLMDWEWTLRGNWGWSTPAAYCHFQAPTMGSTTFQAHRFFDQEGGYDHYIQVYDNSGADKGHYGVVGGAIEATTSTPTELGKQSGNEDRNIRFRTNNPGDYIFNLSFEPSANQKGGFAGKVKLNVTYPIEEGDYRLVYTGGTKPHPGNIIKKRANGEDIVSMYVAAGNASELVLQPCSLVTADAVIWTPLASCAAPTYADDVNFASILSTGGSGAYNFTIKQDANRANPKITKVEKYTGPFYIRTDCVNSDKWNYWDSKGAHTMTYSDYSTTLTTDPYSHYFVKWISEDNVIVKFCVANDYSMALSDTLDADAVLSGTNVKVSRTNVRFMYNQADNSLKRAYTNGPENDNYMLLRTKYVTSEDGTNAWLYRSWTDKDTYTLLGGTNISMDGVGVDTLKFTDNGNWVYQADVYARPGAPIKLTGEFNGVTQYFKGTSGTTYTTDAQHLLAGNGDPQHIRITYDFKTNRMVTAWMPSGSALSDNLNLNADVMIIRQHQGPGAAITFSSDDYKITDVKTVYGVIQLDSATLNDVTLSKYQRDLFWISFPFDVKLSDVFGFGNYYEHWGIQYYDGKGRAKNGYWIDSNSNWKFFTPGMRDTTVLKANEGYVLAVDLDLLGPGASVWDNKVNTIYLYFPSTANLGTIKNIADTLVRIDTVGYQCTIDRRIDKTVANPNLDRRVRDSHWHLIGAPSFAGAQRTYSTSWGEGVYSDIPNVSKADWSTVNLPFIYDWDATTNTLSPVKTGTYTFKPMHSYLVQYGKDTIRWKSVVNALPVVPSVAARQTKQQDFDLTLHILRGANSNDQTFIRLTENEEVTDDFEFGYDLSKETNRSIANVWTVTTDGTPAAGNSMPLSTETKVVPVGVKTPAADSYTFSMPEGTNGVSVVLVDNIMNTRTNLGLTDYTVYLEAGQFDGRFSLEIPAITQTPTGIDQSPITNDQSSVKKVMIDGVLYIVKDGEVFDARGNRVK